MPQFTSAGQGPGAAGTPPAGLEASVRRSVRSAANAAVVRELLGFVAIAYAFTWTCWLSMRAVRDPLAHRVLETAGQYGPLVGAVVMTCVASGRRGLRQFLASLLRWRFNPGIALAALALPPVAYFAAIALYAKWSGVPAQFPSFDPLYDVAINFVLVILWGGPLGEEPGWRGFALPRLQAVLHPLLATIILGIAWAGWHLPRWWSAGGFPAQMVGTYVLALVGFGVVFTYLSNKSGGSVLPCLMLHGSANTFWVILPIERAWTAWTLVIWAVAILITLRDPRLGAGRARHAARV
jgi:membrane protease YdiL (CAAX protease family)